MTLLVLVALAAGPVSKRPVSVESCIEASQAGQEAKLAAKYQQALAGFTECSNPACPAEIRADCALGLSEVTTLTPTIVFAVRDDKGLDLPGAEVLVGGVARPIDGKPLPLDPGPNEVTARRGTQRLTQTVVVSAGEKGRVITFTMKDLVEPPLPAAPAGKSLAGPIAMTVTAAVGLALFTGFGLAGRDGWDKLSREPCAASRTCLESQQTPIRTLFIVADVGLTIAVIAAIASTVWWLLPD